MTPPCFWILDTRPLWPGDKITDAAPTALALLSPTERTRAQAFYFLKDAKLSLASALLKRLFIARATDTPWPSITFARQGDPQHGKPCHAPPSGAPSTLDFNVSHQAGLVALAGCLAADAVLGVDIVCAHERDDGKAIRRAGWAEWVDMHAEVFSAADLAAVKAGGLDGQGDGVRRFYAFWGLKEAYVKMVGEGLLAKWLRDVEFRNVRVPAPVRGGGGPWGGVVGGIEVWQDGVRVPGVELMLHAFEENHMIATAIRRGRDGAARIVPEYRLLSLEDDVYPWAATIAKD